MFEREGVAVATKRPKGDGGEKPRVRYDCVVRLSETVYQLGNEVAPMLRKSPSELYCEILEPILLKLQQEEIRKRLKNGGGK